MHWHRLIQVSPGKLVPCNPLKTLRLEVSLQWRNALQICFICFPLRCPLHTYFIGMNKNASHIRCTHKSKSSQISKIILPFIFGYILVIILSRKACHHSCPCDNCIPACSFTFRLVYLWSWSFIVAKNLVYGRNDGIFFVICKINSGLIFAGESCYKIWWFTIMRHNGCTAPYCAYCSVSI